MGQLQGKIALITGAASGIGAACAATLAREGAKVIATDVNDALGTRVVDGIVKCGHEAIYLPQDVTDEARWAEIVAQIDQRYGGLHILVSNAAIGIGASSIVDLTLSDWRRQTAVNLDAVFLSVKYSIPLMRRSGGGSIILMSSVAGLRGSSFLACYSATKGAVRLFAKSVAMECAQTRDGIRVNSVHPGYIDTPAWGKITQGQMAETATLRVEAAAKASVPVGRPGRADEIANGVLFLASDASSYMTGTELIIDGGIMTGGGVQPPATDVRR